MTPRISALGLGEEEKRVAVATLLRARGSIGLAIDTINGLNRATRRALWPHQSLDSCEPERDLRDALAHVNDALGYAAGGKR